MNNVATQKLLTELFHSNDPADWKDRDGWRRRALYWKMMSISLMAENRSDEVKALFAKAKHADMIRSINDDELMHCLKVFNAIITRSNMRNKLILPPSLTLT